MSQYSPTPNPPQPDGSLRKVVIIGVVIGGALALFIVLALVGLSMMSSEVCDILEDQPVVTQAVGDELECSIDWEATSEDSNIDYFHYTVTGAKGSGLAIVHTQSTGPNASEELVAGEFEFEGIREPLEVE